jgi:hypothetical protein
MANDLQSKIDQFLVEAADCEMIGNLATDQDKRHAFRLRASELRRLAEEVRAEMTGVQNPDVEFLKRHAVECRELAATVSDLEIHDQLIALAADMEQRASQESQERG